MKRVAIAAGAITLAAMGLAATASNTLPASTAGYTSVTVTGATMRNVSYTVTANVITGFTMQLAGSQVLRTASASFNGAPPLACVMGVYDATANQTPLTCTGFNQRADSSWQLTVTVS
ncbi:MAG: hypothetical protein NVSMB55_08630 [Mycobacteriales bacterium]